MKPVKNVTNRHIPIVWGIIGAISSNSIRNAIINSNLINISNNKGVNLAVIQLMTLVITVLLVGGIGVFFAKYIKNKQT